ncbi:lupus La protein [Dendropsophus ebraccatus]|uniref:lupus La protein n=1 Tax=Dendropsophus ebraccatus TaxID=150705 RepID=UPI003831B29B
MAENGDNEQVKDLDTKIYEQIEYYFGDHNLPRDKFLKEQITLDDGWVPLEIMIKFNRLSRLTTDFPKILEALKKSKSGLLEIDEEKCKIRRSPDKPLPEVTEEYKNSIKNRSVYIKGFQPDTSLDEIKEWLEGKGPIENIQMRRTLQKTFKGSIFIVFDTDEAAKKFLENRDLKFKDSDMIILSKSEYFAKKNEERKDHKSAKAKSKQEKANAQKEAEAAEMKSLDEQTGCLLKFSGELDNMTSREDIHELFQNHGEIKWIDFSRGAKEGIILFKSNAKEALEKAKAANNDSLQLKEKDVTWELLEGDEEKAALKKIMEDQQESYNKRKGKGGRKPKGKGRGGRSNDSSRRIQFQGKKKKFDSSDEEEMEENDSTSADGKNGTDAAISPKKRQLEDKTTEEPEPKQLKTEDQ